MISSADDYFWFGYGGLIDLNSYNDFKVTVTTDYDTSFRYIELRLVNSSRSSYSNTAPVYPYSTDKN